MSRATSRWVAVLVAAASIVVSGLVGEYRDNYVGDQVLKATVGQPVTVSRGQVLTVQDVTVAAFQRGSTSSSRGMSEGRFLGIRVRASTSDARRVTSHLCSLVTARGGELYPITSARATFPEAGFVLTTQIVFEVSRDDLAGLQLSCTESGVLRYRSVEVHVDLGLRAADLDRLWTTSSTTELRPVDPEVEVLP